MSRATEAVVAQSNAHHILPQKNVLVLVLVPLSQVTLTGRSLNSGMAGTIRKSYVDLAGREKLRV